MRSSLRKRRNSLISCKYGASQHACATTKIIKRNVWHYLSRDFLRERRGEARREKEKERDKYSLTLAQVIYTVTCACLSARSVGGSYNARAGSASAINTSARIFSSPPPLSFWLVVLSSLPYSDRSVLKDPSTYAYASILSS